MMVVKIKKQKAHKKCVIKGNLKFGNYKNCLAATKLENKINHIENIKNNIVLKRIIKNYELILTTQQKIMFLLKKVLKLL